MIPLPSKPKVTQKETNRAIFEIEALYPGYGITIGNSMRRVLLSSLHGAAVTSVKIKGVSHEFSTIPGVLEDILTITLNLKQLRFQVFSDEPQKATLKIKGEKKIKASDFKVSGQMEIVNKTAHIATLTDKKAELDIEIQVEKGVGYLAKESRKKGKTEVGAIPLDAIFTPIKKVAMKVENMRVGERTDYDRLLLDVETDGTITPEQAFARASEILFEHFDLFRQVFEKEAEKKAEPKEKPKSKPKTKAAKKKKG